MTFRADAGLSSMPKAADRTNDHYAPLFSRFKADVGEGTVQF